VVTFTLKEAASRRRGRCPVALIDGAVARANAPRENAMDFELSAAQKELQARARALPRSTAPKLTHGITSSACAPPDCSA